MSIYEDQPCRECGLPLNGQQAISPNLHWWQHRDLRGCIRSAALEIKRLSARDEPKETTT